MTVAFWARLAAYRRSGPPVEVVDPKALPLDRLQRYCGTDPGADGLVRVRPELSGYPSAPIAGYAAGHLSDSYQMGFHAGYELGLEEGRRRAERDA